MRILSIILPIYKIKKTSSIKSILILSSLNNNGWLLLSIITSYIRFLFYLTIYSLSLVLSIDFLKTLKTKRFNLNKKTSEVFIVVYNIGGIPPSLIFLGKVIIISIIINLGFPKEILIVIIIITCYFIYNYIWCTQNYIINLPIKPQNSTLEVKSVTPQILITLRIITLLLIILGFT